MAIAGSKVLLTGANGGIGRAFVDELLRRDAAKVYLGVRKIEGHDFPEDPRLVLVQLDLTDAASIKVAADQASDANILINNAGLSAFTGALTAADINAARLEMEVNYFGPLHLTQALKGAPIFSPEGAIINISSFLGFAALPVAGTYSAAKAAFSSLTRTIRAELAAKGTQVVVVYPVQVDTRLGAGLPDPKLTPEEVARESLDAIGTGETEVFPGQLSKGAIAGFRADPDAVQAQLAQSVHPY